MANLLDGGSLTYTTSKGETFSKNEFVLILELLYLTIKCPPCGTRTRDHVLIRQYHELL